MARILITYYSKSGNTKTMAAAIAKGVNTTDVTCDLIPLDKLPLENMLNYDGFIFGSPTWYGLPTHEIVHLFDESVVFHGRLAGRVGAAFSSSANIGGGNETTNLGILQMMLVHGMVVVGAAQGDHYGPVSIGSPDGRVLSQCEAHGKRVAEIVAQLFPAT